MKKIFQKKRICRFSASSPEIKYLVRKDPDFKYVVDEIGELVYVLPDDPFLFMAETIIGQMLSNKVADVLSARMSLLCGGVVAPDVVSRLSVEQMRKIGLSKYKARHILGLADYASKSPDFFAALTRLSDEEVIERLTKLPGIGDWSAKMYLIFMLNRLDVLPFEDGAFLRSYIWLYNTRNVQPDAVRRRCAAWKPYSSLAARYLYRALDKGLTRTLLFR
ncbi:MAG: DNA-3-methyladenine glycosylase 2 family protein [Deltaproteobacteria bacterium]|nr:DNA-3-methyladenine glycosylase 2 family protein [Deltaproteobacteria bacterium]